MPNSSLKKYHSCVLLSILAIITVSCDSFDKDEILHENEILRTQNDSLINTIDSLKKIMAEQDYTVITINENFDEVISIDDSVTFYLGLNYKRPNLISSISYEVFETRDMALESLDSEYEFGYSMTDFSDNANEDIFLKVVPSHTGLNYLGGIVKVQKGDQIISIPFINEFEVIE